MINCDSFKYIGRRPDLDHLDSRQDGGLSRDELKDMQQDNIEKIRDLQERLFAEGEQSLLIVYIQVKERS